MNKNSFFDNSRQFCSDLKILTENSSDDFVGILFQFAFTNLVKFCRKNYYLDVQEAEDTASQAIQKFLERLDSKNPLEFDSGIHFLSYLRTVAKNVRLRWIAKELSVSKQVEIDDFGILELRQENFLEKQIFQKELWTIINNKLTTKQVEILRLKYLEGWEIERIALITHLTTRQVKYETSKALHILKKVLEKKI